MGMLIPICEIILEHWFHRLNGEEGGFMASAMNNCFTNHHLKRVLSTFFLGFHMRCFLYANVKNILFPISMYDLEHLLYGLVAYSARSGSLVM